MAGTISVNTIQLGNSATATQNFVLQTNLDGTAKLSRGNVGATTQDIFTIDATGKLTLVVIPAVPVQSMIWLAVANGYGSTNTAVRRFTNTVKTQGTDITYVDSAVNGATFTVNVAGVFAISYTDNFTGGAYGGISVDSTQLNINITAINQANRLAMFAAPAADYPTSCAVTVYLAAGQVIRIQGNGTTGSSQNQASFVMTRVA